MRWFTARGEKPKSKCRLVQCCDRAHGGIIVFGKIFHVTSIFGLASSARKARHLRLRTKQGCSLTKLLLGFALDAFLLKTC